MVSRQVSLIYDRLVERYCQEFKKKSEHINAFISFLPKRSNVLDIGCGFGVDANYINAHGFHVTGIDISKKMISLAKRKFPEIMFRNVDIKELRLKRNYFEGIIAAYSLIHIPKKDIVKVIIKIKQSLKSRGHLFIIVQAGKSEEIYLNTLLQPEDKLFLNVFSFREIKNILFKNRFSIIKKYTRKPNSKRELPFTKLFIIARKN